MPNGCGKTRQIDAKFGRESCGSRIPSRVHLLCTYSKLVWLAKDLRVQIAEIYTLRIIAPHSWSGQYLIETGWKRKYSTNICSGTEILDLVVIYIW